LFPASGSEQVAGGGGDAGSLGLASATSGFDAGGGSGFAGGGSGGVAATETQDGGNTVVQLEDGSTITVVGVTHFDASFVH
jgi:hypothetical protein